MGLFMKNRSHKTEDITNRMIERLHDLRYTPSALHLIKFHLPGEAMPVLNLRDQDFGSDPMVNPRVPFPLIMMLFGILIVFVWAGIVNSSRAREERVGA
tara:strand:- start:1568 stop:1864 length:297 start_codon:yes stop_codon:yes gene_type:complete